MVLHGNDIITFGLNLALGVLVRKLFKGFPPTLYEEWI